MADLFMANLNKIFESINSTIRLATEFGNEEQQDIKPYAQLAEKLVAIEVKYNAHKKGLQESTGEVTPEEFERRYHANAVTGKSSVKNLKRYKEFVAQAKLVLNPSDNTSSNEQVIDEDLQVEETICDIDPITKRPLQVPVRNKSCKHIYEKSAIETLIKNNPRTRCPVMGCAAKQYVNLGDLVEDKMLQHRLRLQRQRMEEEDD
ncbi:E3 SUMO-protein ligase NSE2-like [Uranotaenia lowii]|uniref:E3 SUMO-protein ligase NSE2-like n=1 Tax=Uranotaenia lowii TaxID=190385 RepID=UPI00247B0287|nr:E3 SUMO-protein ligase NSE2-like [Uranotaenia lowii]